MSFCNAAVSKEMPYLSGWWSSPPAVAVPRRSEPPPPLPPPAVRAAPWSPRWNTNNIFIFWSLTKINTVVLAFWIFLLSFTHLIELLLGFWRSRWSFITHSWYSCFWIPVTCFSSLAHLFSRTFSSKTDQTDISHDVLHYSNTHFQICLTCCASKCWAATVFTSWSHKVFPSSCMTLSISVACLWGYIQE